MRYADSQAFLALQGQPPIFDSSKRPQLSLALVTSAPPFLKDFHAVIAAHETFREQALSNPNTHEVLGKGDLDQSGMGLLFGLQCPPEKMTYERVRTLAREGVRAMTLAFDEATEYGSGFLAKGGLTRRGKQLVEWMSECGILLDLSHANHQTAREALDFIRQENLPMKPMASHTGCYEVCQHPRNLPDDVLQKIVERGGYIGISLVTFFLTERKNDSRKDDPHYYLNWFIIHIRHAMYVVDDRAKIGLGSDCPHVDQTIEDAKTNYLRMIQMLKTNGKFGEYFPDRPPEIIEHGAKMVSTLKKNGYTCGRSFSEFLKRSLPQT